MEESDPEFVGEAEALGDGGGLSSLPLNGGVGGVGVSGVVGGREGGGDDVDAVTAGGGVEDEAGGRVGVVGDFGALVGGEDDSGVAVAGGDHGNAAGGEEGSDGGCEGEREVLFEDIVGEVGSGVGAAVGGIDEDDRAGLLAPGDHGKERREEGEARGDGFEGKGQGFVWSLVDCKRVGCDALRIEMRPTVRISSAEDAGDGLREGKTMASATTGPFLRIRCVWRVEENRQRQKQIPTG
jgi:hypothetical protein